MKNKKGVTTLTLIVIIFVAFFMMIMLGILSYGMGQADEAFSDLNITIGNTSFQTIYEQSLQQGLNSLETTVPQIISTGVLIGMVLVMIIIGYSTSKKKYIWILLDIAIIIIAEILAVIIRSSFVDYMNTSPEILAVFRDILPQGAKFILNLPTLVPIMGAIMILATYMMTKERKEEEQTDNF